MCRVYSLMCGSEEDTTCPAPSPPTLFIPSTLNEPGARLVARSPSDPPPYATPSVEVEPDSHT